ncbi:hypothetical protein [Streptomyces sp. NPDC054834]
MSFGDPNNPYGPPPPQPPAPPQGNGYPQQPGVPPQGYGYPQQPGVPPQGYGYPQQPPYGAYPGGYSMPQTMPGLVMTARVLLFVVAGGQVLSGIGCFAAASELRDKYGTSAYWLPSSSSMTVSDVIHMFEFFGVLFLALVPLSITLGVKMSSGRQGIRITTMVYGILGAVAGVLVLLSGANNGAPAGVLYGLLWIAVACLMAAAMMASSGAAWFNRQRY